MCWDFGVTKVVLLGENKVKIRFELSVFNAKSRPNRGIFLASESLNGNFPKRNRTDTDIVSVVVNGFFRFWRQTG